MEDHSAKMREKRLRQWKIVGDKPIRKQMYTVYFVAMVLPIIALGIFLMGGTYNLLSKYHNDLMDSENGRIRNIMFELTTQVRNLSENIIIDEQIQDVLSGEFDDDESFRRQVNKVTLLDSYKKTYVAVSDIAIYCDNRDLVDYKQFHRATDKIKKESWYQKGINQMNTFWTTIVENGVNSDVVTYYLCLVRRIPLIESDNQAIMVIRISNDYLRTIFENSPYETYISVDDDRVLLGSDRSMAGKPMPMQIDLDQTYYRNSEKIAIDGKVCFSQISTLNAYQAQSRFFIGTVNRDGYYEIGHILLISAIIIAFSIILPGAMISFFTKYMTGRIDTLRQEMHKASRRDYELIPVIHGQDEISEAYSDLMLMVEDIKKHEAKVYESQIKEQQIENKQREMEYKMLASQINPHFLYNTLETVRMRAFTAGDREVAEAIKLLGKSMRYVLENTGTAETTLSKELEHIEVYLKIEQLRFEDRFDFVINIEEGIDSEKVRLLPLLLQPMVENSMIHGLEKLDEDGHVRIEIYKGTRPRTYTKEGTFEVSPIQNEEHSEEKLFIDIVDNGDGMDEQTLEELRNSIEKVDVSRSKSIGLYNINQRVKLFYGKTSGMQIDSAEGIGTRVGIAIPLKKCMPEE